MGETASKQPKLVDGDTQTEGEGAGGTGSKGNSSSSRPTSTGGRGRGKQQTGQAGEFVPQLVTINDPASNDEKDTPKKNPPKKKKDQPKKKQQTKKQEKENIEFLKSNLQALIQTGFHVTATKTGVETWNVDDKEAEQIADPLANIINRMVPTLDEKQSDYVALAMALGVTVTPRAMMHIQQKKGKGGQRNGERLQPSQRESQKPIEKGTAPAPSNRDSGTATSNSSNDVKAFIDTISIPAY